MSALLAVGTGAEAAAVGQALALALAPALAGFMLLPHLRRSRLADAGFLGAWLVAAAGLAAGSGGAASPMALGLAIPPALTLVLGRRWTPAAGAAAVLGYALAAGLARLDTTAGLGVFPALMGAASLAFAAAMMAIGQPARAPPLERLVGHRVAEVSHELRTPLTHILGFSEMIERRMFGEIDARYVEYAALIRRSGGHLLSLVNDLLDLSKIEAGRYDLDFAEFDVRLVVEEVVRLSAVAAEKRKIALGLVTPETPLFVRADEGALRRMLINTVGNAIKFTPEGGRIMVRASELHGQLVLETIDNGPGIPEADREKLGEAFTRGAGAAQAEGTGLGLSLVRALAGLHGGALDLLEAPGGGALVRVTLPVLRPG